MFYLSTEVEKQISTLQATSTIICITDPSGANIYIDGVLQPVKTSTSIIVPTGNRLVTFTKTGYAPYSQIITGLKKQQIVNVCAILGKIVDIIDSGIVSCYGPNLSTCPISPIICPGMITPLNYINLIAIFDSISSITITIRFIYTINGVTNNADVTGNLLPGTNIIYAFPANIQYAVNTTLSIEDVILI